MSILEAISPTARELLSARIFCVRYTWNDLVFGELDGSTVITGTDEESALKHFRSINPHLTSAAIVKKLCPLESKSICK